MYVYYITYIHVNLKKELICMAKRQKNTTSPRPPAPAKKFSLRLCLQAFKRLLRQTHLKLAIEEAQLSFYDRIFTPSVTLWYMIFQRLSFDHSLQAAVTDLHSGGADRLTPRHQKPLSQRIKSMATTAFSKARRRLPLALFHSVLAAQAHDIWKQARDGQWLGLRVLLLDGSQISLRPYPDTIDRFTSSANQHGKAYWVLMRVVVIFCLQTGVVISSAVGATTLSEQALACRQILQNMAGCLYLGDRNFGIFRVVQCVLAAKAHCLFRLTEPRAGKLAGAKHRLRRCGDYVISWIPSEHDLRSPDCSNHALHGRLIVAQYKRPGFRTRWIYLFTTLMNAQLYSTQQLLDLYATRWQIELDLRYLKTQMNLDQLECKSADMAEKEWLAGLMAYNLVRALMLNAALSKGLQPNLLSFSATRRLLVRWLLRVETWANLSKSCEKLLKLVAQARQPSRSKPRPPEPRAKRHKGETFPPLRGSRASARKKLKILSSKC
jgi:putative transposase